MKEKSTVTVETLRTKLGNYTELLRHYTGIIFLVFIACLYGFVFYRINTVTNSQPFNTDVNNQVAASKIQHIDQKIVDQLQSLKDNSVNVKTLFEENRTNPFQ